MSGCILDDETKQQSGEPRPNLATEIFVASILIVFYFAGLLWVLATTRKAKRQ